MPLNFPATPTNNQVYFDATSGGRYTYYSNAAVWIYASNTSTDFAPANNWSNTNAATAFASALGYANANAATAVATSMGQSNSNAATVYASSLGYSNGNAAAVYASALGYANANAVAVMSTTMAQSNANAATGFVSASDWANSKVAAITSNSTSRIWANTATVTGIETVYLDLALSGVTATTYGSTTIVPVITVDGFGRITASANATIAPTGFTIVDETASSSTYYPVLAGQTSGTESAANVSSTKLTFIPSTGTLAATQFNNLSDASFKINVSSFDGPEIIMKINPVSFNWRDTGGKSYGVIAQEIEQVLPELVLTNEKGIKSVAYTPLIAILIDVVQKQQKEIEQIKSMLNRIA